MAINQIFDDDYSSIENLPREIIHEIIRLTTDPLAAVITLRTTSKTMKAHAENFAIHYRTGPEIDNVKISGLECKPVPGKDSSPFVARVYLDGPSKCILLKLAILQSIDSGFRVQFLKYPTSFIGKDLNPVIIQRVVLNIYEDDESSLIFLRDFMKDSMTEVLLFNCSRKNTLDFVKKLLERSKKISNLEVDSSTLTDECFFRLRQLAKCQEIDRISLNVYRCAASAVVESLVNLASQVSSMFIYQRPIDDIDKSCRYLLGMYSEDWPSIIIEMFSKKLSALAIKNDAYPEYLSAESVTIMGENMPNIGKDIIFNGSCSEHTERFKRVVNNHKVEVYRLNPISPSSNRLFIMSN